LQAVADSCKLCGDTTHHTLRCRTIILPFPYCCYICGEDDHLKSACPKLKLKIVRPQKSVPSASMPGAPTPNLFASPNMPHFMPPRPHGRFAPPLHNMYPSQHPHQSKLAHQYAARAHQRAPHHNHRQQFPSTNSPQRLSHPHAMETQFRPQHIMPNSQAPVRPIASPSISQSLVHPAATAPDQPTAAKHHMQPRAQLATPHHKGHPKPQYKVPVHNHSHPRPQLAILLPRPIQSPVSAHPVVNQTIPISNHPKPNPRNLPASHNQYSIFPAYPQFPFPRPSPSEGFHSGYSPFYSLASPALRPKVTNM